MSSLPPSPPASDDVENESSTLLTICIVSDHPQFPNSFTEQLQQMGHHISPFNKIDCDVSLLHDSASLFKGSVNVMPYSSGNMFFKYIAKHYNSIDIIIYHCYCGCKAQCMEAISLASEMNKQMMFLSNPENASRISQTSQVCTSRRPIIITVTDILPQPCPDFCELGSDLVLEFPVKYVSYFTLFTN